MSTKLVKSFGFLLAWILVLAHSVHADDLKNGEVMNVLERLAVTGRKRPVPVHRLYKLNAQNCITELMLHDAELQNKDLQILAQLEHLEKLDLSRSNLKDEWMKSLTRFQELKELKLYYAKITNKGVESLRMMVQLEYLELGRTKIDDQALEICRTLPNLRRLGLRDCQVSLQGLRCLEKLEKLECLDLEDTKIDDAAITSLSIQQSLRTLVLAGTQVSQTGLDYLAKSPQLRWIRSPELAVKEFVARVKKGDLAAAQEMSPAGLRIPLSGTYSRPATITRERTDKDKTRHQQRFRVDFYWEVDGRKPTNIFFETAVTRGAIRILEMGIVE